jgi:CheY-like chemotaxis protein
MRISKRVHETLMKTILVLEDEPCVRGLLGHVLPNNGYPVIEAACAKQAAEKCAEVNGNISLLIAEVMLPCSGIPVSIQLRASVPSLKIVLTSGVPQNMWSNHDAALLKELPLDSIKVLPKPFTPSDVLSIVSDLIGEAEIP